MCVCVGGGNSAYIETGFHIFIWLNIAQLSASVVLMQEDGEREDHQLNWLQLHFLSRFAAVNIPVPACTVPPSVHMNTWVSNHGQTAGEM